MLKADAQEVGHMLPRIRWRRVVSSGSAVEVEGQLGDAEVLENPFKYVAHGRDVVLRKSSSLEMLFICDRNLDLVAQGLEMVVDLHGASGRGVGLPFVGNVAAANLVEQGLIELVVVQDTFVFLA